MAVKLQALDPAAAARAASSPRVFLRGQEYFTSGAVIEARETGPGRAVARVQGSGREPYAVRLDYARGELAARCSCAFDWEPVCKHAVAAALALAAPGQEAPRAPRDAAVEKARAAQFDARRASARSEAFEVLARPTRTRPHFVLRSRRTGASYEVLVSAEAAFCTCADFLTSELEACKHVLFLSARPEARRPLARPVVFLQAAGTRGKVHDPLGDVRVVFPAGAPKGALAALASPEGFLDPSRRPLHGLTPEKAAGRVEALLSSLLRGAIVRPEVRELLRAVRERARRRARMEAFAREVRAGRPPPAWRRAVEAMGLALHPYQVEGVLFAVQAGRALLADDMGLGKTVQALTAARVLGELGEARRTLVVCPASLKHQWARETKKAFGAAAEARVAEGNRKARAAVYADPRAPLVIVNYEVLVRDLREIRAARFDLVVLDEAQRIKNWNTRTAKAVKSVRSPLALVLTGTPLENRLAELHSIAEHLDPRLLGPAWRLVPEFGETDENGKLRGFSGLGLVRERLAPVLLRRERSLVLKELPPRGEKTFTVPFTPRQKKPHDEHLSEAARLCAKKHLTEADVLRIMAHLTSARMLANGLALYHFDRVEPKLAQGALDLAALPSPKLGELAQVLEDLIEDKGAKIVVFSQWERMLRLSAAAARPVLAKAGVRPIFFHGGLSSRQRAEAVADFHEDPRARVFFSTDAGGVGLNLQEAASVVVHLEVPWNPAVLDQRVGRVHRMGQKRPVQVVHLVAEGSIEERIAVTVQHKRELFDGLFRGESDEIRFGDGTSSGLQERLKALIGDRASPALGELRQPVDKAVPVVAPQEPEEAPPAPAVALAPPAAFDAAPLLAGLLGALAPQAAAAIPPALPVSLSREGGKLRIELPALPPEAWRTLAAFAQAMAGES